MNGTRITPTPAVIAAAGRRRIADSAVTMIAAIPIKALAPTMMRASVNVLAENT